MQRIDEDASNPSPVPTTTSTAVAESEKSTSWYTATSAETMTYLSCSSGYLSEVIINPSTGEYTKVYEYSMFYS